MFLKKIRTKGFLGHLANEAGDFVELDFADKNLWLIQGANGAGKSSLFDAITMAFFKQHRGGASNFANLVHDKADRAEIFVEFAFHDNDYQIAVDIPKKSTVSRRLQFWNGAEWATKSDDVDDWVARNLKMSYETFVSSVLLRQGEADKFILAKPTPRRAIFLELLQLEFYKKLTERAKFRQKCVGDRAKEIKQNLEVLENPSATEIKAREKSAKELCKELENLERGKSAKQKEFDGAERAQELKTKIEEIETRQKRDAKIFEDAARVEEKFNYFGELKENLSRFENVWREKNEIGRIETDSQSNREEIFKFNEELETVSEESRVNSSAQKSAQTELNALENELSLLTSRRDELKQKLDDIGRIEELESRIKENSEKLRMAQTDVAESDEKIAELNEQIEKETAEKDRLNAQLQEAVTDFRVWEDRLNNRRKVIDKDECPTCGNELKREETRRKLIDDFNEAEQKVKDLERAQSDLKRDFAEAKKQLSATAKNLETETEQRQKFLRTQAALDATIKTARSQMSVSYSPAERETIRGDFAELKDRVSGIEIEFKKAKEKFEGIEKTIQSLEKSKIELDTNLQNAQKTLEDLQSRKEIAETELKKAENRIAEKWKTHAALSSETELEKLRGEKDDLQSVETEYDRLRDARNQEANLEGQKESFERQLKEIPENHRREAANVEIELNAIVGKIGAVKKQFDEVTNLCRQMRDDKLKYEERNKEWKAVQEDLKIWSTLHKALGKDGLETKVVGEAQQKIENNANKTLQALSDGRFKIEIPPDSKEMKIFVRDFSTGEQRQIEYFSGGEKFLTAVSLAIAIGQSASGQNIANTLIIDEGFGALDDKNRSLMVKELERLSSVLQNGRVIVVSHQGDVQESFANRFHLDKSKEGFINVEVGKIL